MTHYTDGTTRATSESQVAFISHPGCLTTTLLLLSLFLSSFYEMRRKPDVSGLVSVRATRKLRQRAALRYPLRDEGMKLTMPVVLVLAHPMIRVRVCVCDNGCAIF
jgi:hypothetical protein